MGVWVGRYAIVDGEVREHGPGLVDRQRQREDETLRLLVLVEPVDRRSAEFCTEVAEAIAALFAREALSITGGLLRALQQAHANLAEWNRRSLREHRVAVGATCVVIREGEVTIAQAGPGLVSVADARGVTRLSTEHLPAAAALGGSAAIDPQFTATTLAGRTLLLLTSSAERAVGPREVEEALAAGPERALAELFRRTRAVRDMTAALIADLDVEEQTAPPPPLDVDEALAGRELALPDIDSGGRELAPRAGDRRLPWSRQQARPAPFPAMRRPARTVGRRPDEARLPWRWIGIGAAALAVIALLVWTVGPGLLREDRQAELDRALATAQAQLAVAAAAPRVDDQRAALQAVLAATERARALAPDDQRVRQLESQAQTRLSLLDAITDVGALTPVLKFDGTLTAPVNAVSLIAGGSALWMIESGRGRLFRIDPGGQTPPTEVYRAGDAYGGVAARAPVSIAWDAPTGRLLLLDAGRSLFAITDAGARTPRPLPLRGAGELRSAVAIAVYLGSLYILDPAGGEIWRYLPAAEGFDSERAGILGGAEIATATALAVDGDVYVLDDGHLRRFRQGSESAPLLDGIDTPLKAPVALAEDTRRGLLYVADRGNRRLVLGDRGGAFVRQYRQPGLADLRGLALAAEGTRVYVLTGDGIAAFDVAPPMPASTPTPATGATAAASPIASPTAASATPAR